MRLTVKATQAGLRGKEGEWPASSELLCWHCCHPFETPPVPLPIDYDERRDVFIVTGMFCSWGCVKRYNLESSSRHTQVCTTYITLLRKKWLGHLEHVIPAPPRCVLEAFGGWMTLEDFRASSSMGTAHAVLPPKMIVEPIAVETYKAQKAKDVDLTTSIDLSEVKTTNETLRIKTLARKKPLTSNDLLKSLNK